MPDCKVPGAAACVTDSASTAHSFSCSAQRAARGALGAACDLQTAAGSTSLPAGHSHRDTTISFSNCSPIYQPCSAHNAEDAHGITACTSELSASSTRAPARESQGSAQLQLCSGGQQASAPVQVSAWCHLADCRAICAWLAQQQWCPASRQVQVTHALDRIMCLHICYKLSSYTLCL